MMKVELTCMYLSSVVWSYVFDLLLDGWIPSCDHEMW
jgi:hypothetical protein